MKSVLHTILLILGLIISFIGSMMALILVAGVVSDPLNLPIFGFIIFILVIVFTAAIGLLCLTLANRMSYQAMHISESLQIIMYREIKDTLEEKGVLVLNNTQSFSFTTDTGITTEYPFSQIKKIKLPHRTNIDFVNVYDANNQKITFFGPAKLSLPNASCVEIHHWLKTHRIKAYRQLLGPSESGVAMMVLVVPVMLLIVGILSIVSEHL